MKLDERLRPIFEEISFIARYRKLSLENSDTGSKMENYSCDEVIRIAHELGYTLSYNKRENFFKLLERTDGAQTQLNISLKFGLVESILSVTKDDNQYSVGGPFGVITRLLGDSERIKYPAFESYDQLRNILKECFSIYEDVKKGLIARDLI